jgi:site-specific DNA-methyltransferase (adenine-specific)
MRNKEIKDNVYGNVYQNTSNGYVLTPSELASEMVDTLPQEVFDSETTTFLDPICKSGTFLFEIVERLRDRGHSVSNIQSRIFTVDGNSHSLNVTNSYINKILTKESKSFKPEFKSEFEEKFFNRLIFKVSSGKFKTLEEFLDIIILDKKDIYLMVEFKNSVTDFISQYEKVSKLESKLFGEVFTPRQLIDEMLDTLPAEVWKNKDLKWLDPAVGIGNFPAAILDRLMVGLEDVISDEDDRRKWILEEMLYMCDISTKNLFLLYQLFDRNNEFKLNVYRGSFLTEDFDKWMKEVWKLDGFDVVVGNPPYQSNEDRQEQGNKLKSYKQPMWPLFIQKGISIINENGFQILITPTSWLSGSYDIRSGRVYLLELFKSKTLHFLNISRSVKEYFPNVSSSFGYFLYQKKESNSLTKVESDFGQFEMNFSEVKMVPRDFNPLAISINSKTIFSNLEKFEIFSVSCKYKKSDRSDTETQTHKIKAYAVGNNKTPIFAFYEKKDQYFGQKKVIIPKGGADKFKPYIDYEGLSIANNQNWIIPIDETHTIENLINYFNSKIIRFLIQNNRYSGFVSTTVAKNLPKINISLFTKDEDYYQHFNLTQEEIDLIEKTIKD